MRSAYKRQYKPAMANKVLLAVMSLGEIVKKPVPLDAALSQRATEIISGTISITFETDSAGNLLRRTKVTKLDIRGPDGPSETETVTEKLERRLISRRD